MMGSSVQFAIVCVVVGLMVCSPVEMRYIKRSVDESSGPRICSRSTPCGWELYIPYQRTVTDFIASPCECPFETQCVRTSDDISVSAFVHRCRPINEVIQNDAE